jgi:hypothetical protein
MSDEFEEKFIKPIINASFPGTLAGLAIAGLAIGSISAVRFSLAFASIGYLLSSFAIFFYSIYPTRRRLWSVAALSFLMALTASLLAVIALAVAQ